MVDTVESCSAGIRNSSELQCTEGPEFALAIRLQRQGNKHARRWTKQQRLMMVGIRPIPDALVQPLSGAAMCTRAEEVGCLSRVRLVAPDAVISNSRICPTAGELHDHQDATPSIEHVG